jgi:Protein of unknown function (DUF3300)
MRTRNIAIIATLLLVNYPASLTDRALALERSAPQAASGKPAKSPGADELDRLLAPIALYPDQLLAQMLLCAANPGKIGALGEWLASHESLKGTELQDAATKAGFEPSFVALVLFPQVVNTMASQLDWTTRLGNAFAADRSAVFGSIQRLRSKAQKAGTLKDTPQQDVETKTSASGQQVIVIEPANPQIVYVPQYNPQVVYTQPASSTVVIEKESSSSGDAVAAGLIGFTAGIAIGAAMDNDYYYGPYGWGRGVYMYDDAWDDWYDAREDAREDWMDHREDIVEDRGDRARTAQEQRTERQQTTQQQRTERQQTRQDSRPESQAQREQRRTDAQAAAGNATSTARSTAESRGYTTGSRTNAERSGTRSDAFSGYSSGKSERAASQRGERSRSSSRSSGGRRR